MIKRFFFFISALVFLYGSTSFSTASYSLTTHTQHTPIELKPISFLELNKVYKVASVCFLGEDSCSEDMLYTKDNSDLTIDTGKQCVNEGYSYTSCALPSYLDGVCPYNENHYSSCTIDNERACEDSGYVKSCSGGEVLDDSQTCPYDTSFKKCKCNPCDGYTYSYSEATAQGYVADGSCQSCSETKYKRKENPCLGYMTCECGGEIGASVCYTGSVQKYNKCKACCANECSLSSCPSENSCRYEACSNKYCITGCATNYTYWCTQPTTNCVEMGYKSTSSCANGGVKCPYGDYWHCY